MYMLATPNDAPPRLSQKPDNNFPLLLPSM